MRVERYNAKCAPLWNNFLENTKNGIFLFNRNYQDYHADRFDDHSLLIFDNDQILAIFPANESNKVVYSHQGLTFGGLLVHPDTKTPEYKQIFELIIQYYKQNHISKILYKPIPYPFTKLPSQEDLYFLFLHKAKLIQRDLSSLIDFRLIPKTSQLRRRMIKKSMAANISVSESNNFTEFYQILEGVVSKHGVKPTHSLNELLLLKERFSTQIKLFVATKDQKIIAGTIVYDYGNVAHTQYLAASEEGKNFGALDAVIEFLINNCKNNNKPYLSFGISTENSGLTLNEGLILQKEGFGARAICFDRYELDLT